MARVLRVLESVGHLKDGAALQKTVTEDRGDPNAALSSASTVRAH